MSMTREQAWDLLTQYNQEEFHLRHAVTVEHVMRWFARELGYGDREEFWGIVGLLHDLDFERWPEEHCKKSQELMRLAVARTISSSTPACRISSWDFLQCSSGQRSKSRSWSRPPIPQNSSRSP